MNRLKLHKKGGRERIKEWKGDSMRLELDGDGKQKRRSVTIYTSTAFGTLLPGGVQLSGRSFQSTWRTRIDA